MPRARQRGGARDVVLPERVAAVDDGVARRHQAGRVPPPPSRSPRPAGSISQTTRGGFSRFTRSCSAAAEVAPFLAERQARIEIGVEHHAFVPVAHQAAGDIRAHPPQTDDTDLHPLPFRHTYQRASPR